jgi:hypothetical protein
MTRFFRQHKSDNSTVLISGMQIRCAIPVIIMVSLAALLAGCTGVQNIPGAAPPGTSSGSSFTTAPAADNLVISPTDVVPSQNAITMTVKDKDYLGNIDVVFDGGTGQIHVKKIDVTLYRSDGQVKTASIGTKKEDNVVLEGTKQTDRVVVYVSFDNGDRKKVTDVLSPYRTRG